MANEALEFILVGNESYADRIVPNLRSAARKLNSRVIIHRADISDFVVPFGEEISSIYLNQFTSGVYIHSEKANEDKAHQLARDLEHYIPGLRERIIITSWMDADKNWWKNHVHESNLTEDYFKEKIKKYS